MLVTIKVSNCIHGLFILHIGVFSLVYVCAPHVCLVPVEARRGFLIP